MTVFHKRITTDDVDEIRDLENTLGIESRRRQLSRGRGVYDADFVDLDGVFLWRYRDSHRLSHEYVLPRGSVEICVARCPDALIWKGIRLPHSAVAIHRGGEVYESVVPEGSTLYGFVFPEASPFLRAILPPAFTANASGGRSATRSSMTLVDPLLTKYDELLSAASEGMDLRALVHSVVDDCQKVVASSFRRWQPPSRLNHKAVVDGARDIIRADLAAPLTIATISQRLDVTRRTLERAFREHLGITPYQLILVERLHAARQLLKADGQSVLQCCTECGFEDPSRFAQMYARHFGELPSRTLRG